MTGDRTPNAATDSGDAALAALFETATQSHAAGRIEAALDGYLQVLAAAPGHIATLVHVAAIYLDFGRHADARLVLDRLATAGDEKLLFDGAGLPSACLTFASFCADAGETGLADRLLARALQAWPDDPALNEAAALRLADDGDCDVAEAYFQHALSLAPDRISTWLLLAEFREAQGDTAGALEVLLEVLERVPGHRTAVRRAITVIEQGLHDSDLAAHFLRRLAELIEEDGEALAYIGFKMLADERFEGALAAFARASDLDLDTHETLIGSGTAAYGLGEEAAAESYWSQGLAAIPDDADDWLSVAETFSHDLPRGMLHLLMDGAAKRAAGRPDKLCEVATLACELALHELAGEIVGRALALDPNHRRGRELEEAIARFRKD